MIAARAQSVKGAESSAIVYSLVETAKANGVEPYEYLLLVLSMLPYLGKSPAHDELENLMPWHPAVRQLRHFRSGVCSFTIRCGHKSSSKIEFILPLLYHKGRIMYRKV